MRFLRTHPRLRSHSVRLRLCCFGAQPISRTGSLLRAKLRNTQHEQMSSACPPRTDIGLARPKHYADRMLWNFLAPAPRSRMVQFASRWTGLNFADGLEQKPLGSNPRMQLGKLPFYH